MMPCEFSYERLILTLNKKTIAKGTEASVSEPYVMNYIR